MILDLFCSNNAMVENGGGVLNCCSSVGVCLMYDEFRLMRAEFVVDSFAQE